MLHQVGNLFELNVKLRCQKVKYSKSTFSQNTTNIIVNYKCDDIFRLIWSSSGQLLNHV